MSRTGLICLMAQYNAWMNDKVYAAAARLPAEALLADRKAFFGSIVGTLNHLVVADTIWLKRFASHPANYPELEPVRQLPMPTSLDQLVHSDIERLSARRTLLDQIIVQWTQALTEQELDQMLSYRNTKGVSADRPLFSLLVHFFNHQTHHRGQASTLFAQAGIDIGVTDLLALILDAAAVNAHLGR